MLALRCQRSNLDIGTCVEDLSLPVRLLVLRKSRESLAVSPILAQLTSGCPKGSTDGRRWKVTGQEWTVAIY